MRDRVGLARWVSAATVAAVLSLFVTAGPLGVSSASATTTTITFPYDGLTGLEGAPQFWVVPPRVYYATFRVSGAQGGRAPGRPFVTGVGGRGGEVTATLAVKAGELLEINVGGMPGSGTVGRLLDVFGEGGFNGGNAGGGLSPFTGGGGGGASDVRRSPFGLADRLLVAGGGGGAGGIGSGGNPDSVGPSNGGAGGESGGAGMDPGQSCPLGGGGGRGDRGGVAGYSCGVPYPQGGGQGNGGRGAAGLSQTCTEYGNYVNGEVPDYPVTYTGGGGGGGGGGYYGGGGGGGGDDNATADISGYCYGDDGTGGGGGSGYGPASAVFRSGARGGNGMVTVTYTPNCSRQAPCVRSVPGAPTNVEAAAGNHTATVAFATPRVSTLTTYKATASPGGETASGTSSPLTVKNLKNGTNYSFTVIATNELGTGKRSKPSNQITPAPPPGAPTNVTAIALNHEAIVSFSAPRSRWSPIVGYKVIVQPFGREPDLEDPFMAHDLIQTPPPGGGAVPIAVTVPGSEEPPGSPITVTGLTDGVMYEFMVRAINGIGPGPLSDPSNAVIPVGPPKAPTNVTATAGNAEATISFTRPYADGSPITSYTVTASPSGATATGKRGPITLTGLTNGTSYTFTVTARNALGASRASTPSNAVTPLGGLGVTVRLVGSRESP